jgi:hypothetical protein
MANKIPPYSLFRIKNLHIRRLVMLPIFIALFSVLYAATLLGSIVVSFAAAIEEFLSFWRKHNEKTKSLFPIVVDCWSNK